VSTAVRPLTQDDVPGAARALLDVHMTDGYPVDEPADPQAWLRPPGVLAAWVAELDGVVVGHVAVTRSQGDGAVPVWQRLSGEPEEGIGVLARLYVTRAARGHALGERLLRQAMAYARAHGLRLVLDVVKKDASAIRLYERLGWERIGEVTHPFGPGGQSVAACYVWPGD
jgi:ribosomal protein S18 acetylase RimI-like enzyme